MVACRHKPPPAEEIYNEPHDFTCEGPAVLGKVGSGPGEVVEMTGEEVRLFAGAAAENHTHTGGSAPVVKSGVVSLGAGGSANVVFATPFSSVPVVVPAAQFSNADTSCTYSCHSITVNGFTIRGSGNPAGLVGWIATSGGNL